jgi:hypothetical protein
MVYVQPTHATHATLRTGAQVMPCVQVTMGSVESMHFVLQHMTSGGCHRYSVHTTARNTQQQCSTQTTRREHADSSDKSGGRKKGKEWERGILYQQTRSGAHHSGPHKQDSSTMRVNTTHTTIQQRINTSAGKYNWKWKCERYTYIRSKGWSRVDR